jgi:hypothetical protein
MPTSFEATWSRVVCWRTITVQVLVRVVSNPGHLVEQDKLKLFMVDSTGLIKVMVVDRMAEEEG